MKKYLLLLLIIPFLGHTQNINQEIVLSAGWSLFSTYIIPENNTLDNVFSSIMNDVIIIKDENGNVYWPEYNLDLIGGLTIGESYLIKMNTPHNLTISGIQVNCNTEISLNDGWNLIGYLNSSPSSIEDQFESIIDDIVIIKDDSGNVYWPLYDINSINTLNPGKGYQVKVSNNIIFNYNCELNCNVYSYNCDGGTWQEEVFWQILNQDGDTILFQGAPVTGEICLTDGCYNVIVGDIYGDGWQGNSLNIAGLTFINENLDGCSNCGLETQIFEICFPIELIFGCTDSNASNYNQAAEIDDDSCIYPISSLDMDLISTYDYDETINDIWGYATTQNEYALVGTNEGFSVVDISIPENPIELFFIEGTNTIWRDIKTWQNYAYIVCDNCNDGLLIVDLNDMTGQTYSFNTEFFNKAHNIFIDENGFLYAFGGNPSGVMILNLNNDPTNPTYEGINNTFYLHDGMARNDTLWGASTSTGEFIIYDVSNKNSPTIIASQPTPGGVTHNCWISEDGNTLFTTQEYSGGHIRSYDVSDIYNISMSDQIQSWSGFTDVVPHNTHVIGNYLITSYYTDGVTIVDTSDPYNLIEVAYFDTSPQYQGDGYYGCWGAYPYLPSGLILATDRQNGLHVLTTPYSEFFND